ncbi:MAG: sigma-70 family RNA polymerase sigma factor [Candidatus Pacebacteria bacterium]|nr:sigma-70 family RNA polymerase sigma factor [Candidatus Paceibacterota bacterium]
MPQNESDEEIILAFQGGDATSFKKIIDRYTPAMFNFSARLAGREKADDIVQEIFIKVWKNLGRFDATKASFKTWIFTIAKNTTTDFLRKRKDYSFTDLDKSTEKDELSFSENIVDENLLPDAALQKIQDKEFLDTLLEKLSPNYKEILVLHYQEEMTFDEIGKILNKPLNTVKSQHRRAIAQLRELID